MFPQRKLVNLPAGGYILVETTQAGKHSAALKKEEGRFQVLGHLLMLCYQTSAPGWGTRVLPRCGASRGSAGATLHEARVGVVLEV